LAKLRLKGESMSDDTKMPAGPLQFDKAEYPASRPSASACAVCNGPLTQRYYTVNTATLCEPCHGQVKATLAGGSKLRRAVVAAAFGLLAGLAGAAIWYVVRVTTGYELGLIAIVVGLMVGVAVRKGSNGRGGWFYQTLAIVLTYTSIGAQYLPDVVESLMKDRREQHAPVAAKNPAAGEAQGKDAARDGAEDKPAVDDGLKPQGIRLVLGVALLLVFALAGALALPILIGMQNPIGLLIVGIALYEAWKINKGSAIRILGPFQLAPSAESGLGGT
jgi:hypothetical protein